MNLMTKRGTVLRGENEDRVKANQRGQTLLLGVALALTLQSVASAQSCRVLKSFTGPDGSHPVADLVLGGGTLYGTTYTGGTSNFGVVFKVNTDGSGYTILKSFAGPDGTTPVAGLVLADSTLYGTAAGGGTSGTGVVFKVNTDGSGYAILKSFTGSDGATPLGRLVLANGTLYGTTRYGGSPANSGVVFKMNTDGSDYAVLKTFTSTGAWQPTAGLVLGGSTLFGMTLGEGWGTVFKVNVDGSGYAVLKDFGFSDGRGPVADLALAGITLYGTTTEGGPVGPGVVFRLNTDGSDYTILKSFAGPDGSHPGAGLVLADNMLYGTTRDGGTSNLGVVFALTLTPAAIDQSPMSQTVELESAVAFSVQAHGDSQLTYRWYFAETNLLSMSTNPVLQLANVQLANAGAYLVVVSNLLGAVTSSPAFLSVIAPVPRRMVPGFALMGQAESSLNLDSRTSLVSSVNWETFDTVPMTNAFEWYFDVTAPLPSQRFYRAWQTNVLSPPSIQNVHLVPAITLTGAIGGSVRVDYINQFGPIDAWMTNLAMVTLTNTSQLYFDTSCIGQPPRLYRLVPVP